MKKFLILFVILISVFIFIKTTNSNDVSNEPINKPINEENIPAFSGSLSGENAILIDIKKNRILFEKNSKDKCYPASTTKILTALLAIENYDLSEKIIVGDEANLPSLGSSKAGIRFGERLTMKQLLNCMLIPSGNDAAYTIAVNVARKIYKDENLDDREAVQCFCDLMNKRANKLGAKDSNFINPDGFHDNNHYTTAYDMCLIASEAFKYKEFREIVCKESYRLPDIKTTSENNKKHLVKRTFTNTNKLILDNDPVYYKYATGMKTGHTDEAGYCLISTAETNGEKVMAVIMNSTEKDIWSDSTKLLDWGIK